MTTRLEKTLKREVRVGGREYIIAISPDSLKLTQKGHRKGLELRWDALVSGDAALAVALNASVGALADTDTKAGPTTRPKTSEPRPTRPSTQSTVKGPDAPSRAAPDRKARGVRARQNMVRSPFFSEAGLL